MLLRQTTLFISLMFLLPEVVSSQNTRRTDENNIGWYNYMGTFQLTDKVGIHTEYQWRRNNFITDWQQSLIRVGLNYLLHPKIQLRLGYALAETYSYGDIPINAFGKDFTEHRIFQMISITDKISFIDLSHRFMLEQRFIGRYSNSTLESEDEYPFVNRMRYMFRTQIPLKGKKSLEKTIYLALFDEILIGFGKNINENVFDQNRYGLLFGRKFNKMFKLELGYVKQMAQFGREIQNRNIFQYNQGPLINAIFIFDVSRKQVD